MKVIGTSEVNQGSPQPGAPHTEHTAPLGPPLRAGAGSLGPGFGASSADARPYAEWPWHPPSPEGPHPTRPFEGLAVLRRKTIEIPAVSFLQEAPALINESPSIHVCALLPKKLSSKQKSS